MLNVECFVLGFLATNTYVVWDEQTKEGVIIDPADKSDRIISFIYDKGISIKHIWLTHGHPDHTNGCMWFIKELGDIPIAMSRDDLPILRDRGLLMGILLGGRSIEISIDLKDLDILSLGSKSFRVLKTPGHTPGSVCFYYEGEDGKVLFSGDVLFEGSIGRTDLPGGDMMQMERSLLLLSELDDDVIVYPGHGPSTTIANERLHNPYWPR